VPASEDFVALLQTLQSEAQDAILTSQQTQAKYHDRYHKPACIEVDNQVMVSTKYIHPSFIRGAGSKKLKAKFIGPYKVLAKRNTMSFLIDLSNHIKVHPIINIQYLQLNCQNNFAGCKQIPPLPVEATPAETLPTYGIVFILDHMQSGRHIK